MTNTSTPSTGRQPIPGLSGMKFLGPQTSLFRFFGDPVRILQSIHREHGRIGAVIAGDSSLVCAFGAEYNQRLLSDANQFYNFADLPFPIPPDSAAARVNMSLTAMNGEHHRRSRRLEHAAYSRHAVLFYPAGNGGFRVGAVPPAPRCVRRFESTHYPSFAGSLLRPQSFFARAVDQAQTCHVRILALWHRPPDVFGFRLRLARSALGVGTHRSAVSLSAPTGSRHFL